jgi:predicted RNA polymerase sigma factor
VVALASVLRQTGRVAEALALLNDLGTPSVAGYQPYWVLRTHCLHDLGEIAEAGVSAATALRLTTDAAVRDHLLREFGLPDAD